MMEQLYLARERSGIVHAARTQNWKSLLDWNERGIEDDYNVEETLCDEHNFFDEVHGVPITCVTCAVLVAEIERELGLQWKEPPCPPG